MSLADALPPALNLPPHLSAQKYFLVCTLTVAAWDTLVLSPRTWRLMKTPGWPALKILFHFLRVWMPVEFVIVAVAFFDTKWTQDVCQKFYLFEPICTAILLAATSAIHVIRIHAIYDKDRVVLFTMGALFAVQVVVTAICCGFYLSVPLLEGQGCIAGPQHNWVGIYWLAPTLLYTVSFLLALKRSLASLKSKPLSPWKLMLRDGLNLYGAICAVHLINVLFWFAMRPTGPEDPIKTIVTSMAAVLTTSMSLRIILSVRGSLAHGGSFALSSSGATGSSRTTHVISTRSGAPTHISSHVPQTYTLDDIRSKPDGEWGMADPDGKSSVTESKGGILESDQHKNGNVGVKITIDREVGYDYTK
ncbi:hypothetical protein BDN72DRAFT_955454 [Pluteus cervinus]|uniref:Uncharacterized protein n=1 Tax=Pluteus cervinus TaxID=181527 RepID=A0ACD3B8Z0_9AGAR|nr:hypothetical protein BDN72DRAFT_955454 [Pluteus cervinus]